MGTYIALATANRVVDPCSKLAFSDWWATTAGDRFVHLPAAALDHRRFWDAMDEISETQLAEIERRIVTAMVEAFEVDLSGLVLDMTNFATYIDSANDRAPIAQRGHAKQKRSDLRLVGLGLVVSTDGGIPLVSHAYAGNRPDVTQFPDMVDELVARFAMLADRAWASSPWSSTPARTQQDNLELIEDSPLHFVGSLPPSDHPDLLAVAKSRYRPSTRRASPASAPSRPPRSSSASSGASWSPTRRTCTTSSPAASTRPSPRPAGSSASWQPAWPGARPARPAEKVEAEIEAILQAPVAVPGHLGHR